MTPVRDVDNAEALVLRSCGDFDGANVLEVGCGDGRLTWLYAPRAESVLGIDPEEESIATARSETPPELAERVRFEVRTAEDLSKTAAFEVAFLSWSL
jgi:2-polyprenyl-3-methyl-5-hydroxy-6-metoxy-1,4-benzoquinol methylase